MSFVVNVEEGAEQSVAAGDKHPEPVDELGVGLKIPIRNYANETNYRYGITAGAPRVMRLLEQYGFKCTFTAAAVALELAPDLARQIAAAGHEVCSHGHRWVHQFSYKEDREREFIRMATESIRKSVGERPLGWLSRYLFTPNTRRLLVEEGYFYHMDDFGDDVPRWDFVEIENAKRPIVIVPYALDTNDMKFWIAPRSRRRNGLTTRSRLSINCTKKAPRNQRSCHSDCICASSGGRAASVLLKNSCSMSPRTRTCG